MPRNVVILEQLAYWDMRPDSPRDFDMQQKY